MDLCQDPEQGSHSWTPQPSLTRSIPPERGTEPGDKDTGAHEHTMETGTLC